MPRKSGIPARFAASKLIEGDDIILEKLKLDQNERELLEHIILQLEKESGMDRNAALANMRFAFIDKVCNATVVRPKESKEHIRSQSMDQILTGKYTAIPSFAAIMALIFWLTFGVIGSFLSDLMEQGIGWLTAACDSGLTAVNVNPVIHSLIIDGVFAGVGSVLSFLPIIVTLFFLPVVSGRQWLYGEGGLCHGQNAPQNRPFGEKLCADDHRIRLLSACHHGHEDAAFGAGPENDHPADALHELFRQAAHLCVAYGSLFPKERGAGDDDHVFYRHRGGDPVCGISG